MLILNLSLVANIVYTGLIMIMVFSSLWVLWDARKRGKPWGETIVWSLFAGWFLGLGLIAYLLWSKKFPQ